MTIAFPCEKCGHRFEVDASLAGKKCKCKKCDHIFLIPVPRQPSASPSKTLKTFGDAGAASPAASATPRPASRAAKSATRPASAPPPAPDPYYDESDPYGIDDLPTPPRKAPAAEEDEEFLPPKALKPASSKAKKKKRANDEPADIPTWGYLIVIAVMVGMYVSAFNSGNASLYRTTSGLQTLILVVGFFGTLVVAFMRVGAGGLWLFVPIANLVFIYRNYNALRPWANIYLSGVLISTINGGYMGATMATMDQAGRERALGMLNQRGAAAGPVPPMGGGNLAPPAGWRPERGLGPARPPMGGGNAAPIPGPGPMFRPPFPNAARPSGLPPTPNFGGPPPAPAAPADSNAGEVVLNVTGMADGPTRDAFNAKLDDLVQTLGNHVRKRSTRRGDRATITIRPVRDAQAFADQIHFAKVVGVDGQKIDVVLTPGEVAATDTDFIDQALSDLKSPTPHRRKQALVKLRGAPPDEARRAEVSQAVEPLLKDPDGWVRGDAARALAVWGGKENTAALTQALSDPDFGVRSAVLDAITAMKDPAAAEPVAALLEKERGKAGEALKAMGSGAEPAVIKYLSHRDGFVRMEACKVLQVIGTKACVPALKALFRKVNGQGLDAMAARDAVQAIGLVETVPRKKSVVPGSPKRR